MVLHAGKHDYEEEKSLYGMACTSVWYGGIDGYNRLIEAIQLIQICI